MLFNSSQFPIFLLCVLVLFHLAPKRTKTPLLLIASYIFYSFWNWKFSFLLATSTVVDYYCGRWLDQSKETGFKRDKFLYLSLFTNLSILGFFKYFNFFIDSFAELAAGFGLAPSISTLNVILPVGISFYTFQTISYSVDVRNRTIPHCKDFWQFALYVSFFPQLVAGPIEKARDFLHQLKDYKPLDGARIWAGLTLVTLGYVKKVALSDQIAPISDAAFANWYTLSSIELWEGLFIFSLQIYFDFSGYTDIARGVAKWFGVDLRVNFRQPYLSQSVSEFWTRWHISLSSWLKEYLYIPLGGNRNGRWKTYRNLMTTMLLGGLWHGANWTFVLWGFLHGLYLSVHKLILEWKGPAKSVSLFAIIFKILCTHFLVLMTWLPFRAPDFETSIGFAQRMFAFVGPMDWGILAFLGVLIAIYLLIDLPLYRGLDETASIRLPRMVRVSYVVAGMVLVLVLGFHQTGPRPFIYFQF